MDLEIVGKGSAPEVLLLGGAEALRPLTRSFCLLIPSFEEADPAARLDALETALLRGHGGRIRGIYALGDGASLALRLLGRGRVRVRAAVLEGDFALPEDLPPLQCAVNVWYRKKDKAAKERCEALRELAAPLSTLSMKKLPKGTALADIRPDLAAERLEKIFGGGVCVTRAAMVPAGAETVWRELCLFPAGEQAILSRVDPIRCEDAERLQLVEGRSKHLRYWSHLIRLESADDELTRVTDQLELDAGRLSGLAAPLAELFLKTQQLRRNLAVKKHSHAL